MIYGVSDIIFIFEEEGKNGVRVWGNWVYGSRGTEDGVLNTEY